MAPPKRKKGGNLEKKTKGRFCHKKAKKPAKIKKTFHARRYNRQQETKSITPNIDQNDTATDDTPIQPRDLLLSTFTKPDLNVTNKLVKSCKQSDSMFTSSGVINSGSDEPEENITIHKEEIEGISGNEDEMDCENEEGEGVNLVVDNTVDTSDPFLEHLNYDLSTTLVESLTSNPVKVKTTSVYWANLHNLKIEIPLTEEKGNKNQSSTTMIDGDQEYAKQGTVPEPVNNIDWNKLCVKSQIQNNIRASNKNQLEICDCDNDELTPLQKEIFSIINNYQDLFYPERTLDNGEEIRFVYCLHAVNHILKTRLRVLHHNERLLKRVDELIPDEYRDQGLVRPKVLILVPFKESCYRIVKMISSILIAEDKGNIINKKRFEEEFTGSELITPKLNSKPEDYENLFKGNIDDKFKIGLSLTKKSLKLYADFYSSDIIIASPLGLRMVIGAEGDKKRDFDFLASLELLILDQAELFLMQNWDHLLLIFDHLHIQPKESHGTDFSRIRSWVLQGWSKFYRQTLLFSSIVTPELNSIFNRRCQNYSGKIRVVNPVDCGSISMVVVPLSHVFQKFKADSVLNACEMRFKFFIDQVLPQYRDPTFSGVLIYVPSYFDYVKIRNYLKREDYSFVQICEYSKDARIARARDKFFHSDVRFLLYSERFHFFRRIKLKGIRHIIFYQLPTFPHFYSELCNSIRVLDEPSSHGAGDCGSSVTVLYCKYDMYQLSSVIKTVRASKLLSSDKDVHMFTTG